MSLASGDRLGRYRLVDVLGRGGMGVAWRARDEGLGRDVVLKVLQEGFADDPRRRRRLLAEARILARFGDPRIVQLHDIGDQDGVSYLVMELVEGRTLEKILRGGPLPPARAVAIAREIARALDRAHREGLVHRDVKPANVVVTPAGDVKLLDFGLAALAGPLAASSDPEAETSEDPLLLRPGAGTLAYMAPEQLRGEEPDPRSDIFSLGVVLYEMLTGRQPFTGGTSAELAGSILHGEATPLEDVAPAVPSSLARIVARALARDPARRYPTAATMAEDLARVQREILSSPGGTPRRGPGRRRGLAGAALLVAAATLAVVLAVPLHGAAGGGGTAGIPVTVRPFEIRGEIAGNAGSLGRAFAESIAVQLSARPGVRATVAPRPAGSRRAARTERLVRGTVLLLAGQARARVFLEGAGRSPRTWQLVVRGGSSGQRGLERLGRLVAAEVARELHALPGTRYEYPCNPDDLPDDPLAKEVHAAVLRWDFPWAGPPSARLLERYPRSVGALSLRAIVLMNRWAVAPTEEDRIDLSRILSQLEQADPGIPLVPYVRAFMLSAVGQPAAALRLYDGLLRREDLSPFYRALVLQKRADLLTDAGRFDEALADLGEARHLAPLHFKVLSSLTRTLYFAGRPAEALPFALQAVTLGPSARRYLELSQIYQALGRHEDANAAARESCRLGRAQPTCAYCADTLWENGRRDEAIEMARYAESLPDSPYGCYNLACFYSLSGDRRRAIRYLQRAYELGLSDEYVLRDPDLAPLRDEPEFREIAEKIAARARIPEEPPLATSPSR